MKKKVTTILAMCLCIILTLTAISPATAQAAEKAKKIKVTFKGETITLSKDINEKQKMPKLKTLKTKWGKPAKTDDEWETIYEWSKGESKIDYVLAKQTVGCSRDRIRVRIYDKNIKVNGMKVGMKTSKAEKILNELGAGEGEHNLYLPDSDVDFHFYETDGKVSEISVTIGYK